MRFAPIQRVGRVRRKGPYAPPEPEPKPMPEPPAAPPPTPPPAPAGPDDEAAGWAPAHPSNYRKAQRPEDFPINLFVIHVAGRGYQQTIDAYQNAGSGVCAHYVINHAGDITQMVNERDYALHSGNVRIDQQSIAIEHEGLDNGNTWFTQGMYEASAALVRRIARRHGIPLDRDHVIGHNEVPGTEATDPGVYWDWDRYTALIQQERAIIIDNANPVRFWAGNGWEQRTWNAQKYGQDYRITAPVARPDTAWFRVPFPRTGLYDVYVWYPSSPSYCNATPIILATADGEHRVYVDQRQGGGRWMPLGTFRFNQGDYWAAAVSRHAPATGQIVADAFKFLPKPSSP